MAETKCSQLSIPRFVTLFQKCARHAGFEASSITLDDDGNLTSEWLGNTKAVRKSDFLTRTMRGPMERILVEGTCAVRHSCDTYPLEGRAWRSRKGYKIDVNYGHMPVSLAISGDIEIAMYEDGAKHFHGSSAALAKAGIKHHGVSDNHIHRRTGGRLCGGRNAATTLLPDGSILHWIESVADQLSRLKEYAAWHPELVLPGLRKDPAHQRFMAQVLE